MILDNKQVAIIGGGPAGLTLGRLLQEKGVNVKIYERDVDRNARQQGSTLDLHYDTGLRAIETAGLLEEFKRRYRPGADKAVLLNKDMKVMVDEHTEVPALTFGDELFRPEIDRGPLRDMLVDSLKPFNIVWNARVIDLTPSGPGWNIHFEDGSMAYADLVIAADGANSRLRKYITDIRPIYSGVTDIVGNIYRADIHAPQLWALVKGGSLFALGEGKSIKFISKGDGTLTFLIGLKVPETWFSDSGIDFSNPASVAAWFEWEFASWNPAWKELFEAETVEMIPNPWYHFPSTQHWETLPNLTMIGDAAHRIPAYGGEGANQALADAVDLYAALCCSDFETIAQALASYESVMLSRSAEITDMAVSMAINFHSADNLPFGMDILGGFIS
jgi:2-polyprenyl-6-methoxyphenol hydroxylase-like FAD-dependent oxidoreductase